MSRAGGDVYISLNPQAKSDGKLDALSISTPYKAMASHHGLEPNSPTGLILLISSETMVLPPLLFFPLSPVED